jgi:hypothetical protein
MTFLTSIDIIDTGFVSLTTRTSQFSTANRVNLGAALKLKGVAVDFTSSSNLDDGGYPGIYSDVEVPVVSSNPDQISITINLNSSYTDTSNPFDVDDMSLIAELIRLPKTKGIKAIYYPVDITANDVAPNTSNRKDRQLIYNLGTTDTVEAQGDLNLTVWTGVTTASSKTLKDIKYIPVRFKDCKMTQDATTNSIRIILTGVKTI